MRTRVWFMSLVLASLAVACGDQPTEVVPERDVARGSGMMAAATSSSDDGLSITTDKDDYSPGDTVWFTGAGWPADDTLDILLEDQPATHEPHAWLVTVEEDGTFRDSTYVVDGEDVGVSFTLTATSRATGRWLKVQFTDGNVRVSAAPNGVAFTVTRTVFSAVNCGGNITSGPEDIVISAGTNPIVAAAPATGPPSVRLVATATSAAGATFDRWTSSRAFTVNASDNRSICLNGGSGNLDFVANYSATPDLEIVKGTTGEFKVPSANAAYTFNVKNNGSATAEGSSTNRITVTDLLPTGINPPASSPFTASNWTCTVAGQTVTCRLATGQTILPGESMTFSFGVGVTVDACPSVTNSAIVSGGNEPSENTGNNTSADVDTPITDGCPNPNQAPSANAGQDKEGNEGAGIQLDGSQSTDPDGDTPLTLEWGVQPLSGFDTGATCYLDDASLEKPSVTCTDDGVVKITLKVKDSEGLSSANVDEVEVTVKNVKPTVTVSPASATINEGGTASFTATVTDPGANDKPADFGFAWTTSVGPCSTSGSPTITNASYSCTDNGIGTVKLSVDDEDENGQAYDEAGLTVDNVAPEINSIVTPGTDDDLPASIFVNGTVHMEVDFDDPGTDTHKAQIKCGPDDVSYVDVGGVGDDISPFTTSCTFGTVGAKTIYVKVTDDDGGSVVETRSILVTYKFVGFSAPVDRPTTLNLSKAGQAIPLKWQLLDANNQPIDNLTAVNITIGSLNCTTSTATDLIEEYASGSSGLHNLGGGNYQFNWKTPTGYAGTCKNIGLDFGGGYVERALANFNFKR